MVSTSVQLILALHHLIQTATRKSFVTTKTIRTPWQASFFFENENNVFVGQEVKEHVQTDGDRVVQFVKRKICKRDSRVYEFEGKAYMPVEISALILKS